MGAGAGARALQLIVKGGWFHSADEVLMGMGSIRASKGRWVAPLRMLGSGGGAEGSQGKHLTQLHINENELSSTVQLL